MSPPRETDARPIPLDEDTLQAIGELIALGEQEGFGIGSAPMPKGRRSDTWPRWAAVTSRDSISQTLPAPRSVPYRGTEVTQPRHFVTMTECTLGAHRPRDA